MKRYKYTAKSPNGQQVAGIVEASTPEQAARLVRQKGLVVLSIKIARESAFNFLAGRKKRVSSDDVAAFTRQMATMINAGLPITESLVILRAQTRGPLQKVISRVLSDVEGGEPLSKAFSKYPDVFSSTFVALVKSGEVGGAMDEVFMRLADNLEKQQEFNGKVKGALIYPAIIIVGMIVVGVIMMLFVVPKLTSLYGEFDAELPLPTKILIGISSFGLRFWPLFLILLIAGIYFFDLARKTPQGKRQLDGLVFRIPIFGELQREIILTELTRTLSLMMGSGVSILEGLSVTASVVGNVVISDALKDAGDQVEKGFPVAYAFAKHPEAFPYILSQMVSVGEETGKMAEVLGKVSSVFEVESNQKVKTLTSAIEPLVMILLGLGVGFLVIAVILPIYNLTSKF